MRKFMKKHKGQKPLDTKVKAESEVPSLSDNLTPTPRERRDARRETALAEADAAIALRSKPKAVKGDG